jgi:exodeoxyribonuclease V alpha subunit
MSVGLASRIVRQSGEETAHVVRTDPYRLALEVQGVGFMTADAIAMKNGIARDSAERASAGVLFTLGSAASRGHTYLPRRLLVQETARLLGVKDVTAASRIDALHSSGLLHVEQSPSGGPDRDPVFLPGLAEAESESARMLAAIARSPGRTSGLDPSGRGMDGGRAKDNPLLQAEGGGEAMRIQHVHGPHRRPGTGKTSTITAIIHLFDRAGAQDRPVRPTGRAASGMSEATGYDASTIHRLLEFNRHEGVHEKRAVPPGGGPHHRGRVLHGGRRASLQAALRVTLEPRLSSWETSTAPLSGPRRLPEGNNRLRVADVVRLETISGRTTRAA